MPVALPVGLYRQNGYEYGPISRSRGRSILQTLEASQSCVADSHPPPMWHDSRMFIFRFASGSFKPTSLTLVLCGVAMQTPRMFSYLHPSWAPHSHTIAALPWILPPHITKNAIVMRFSKKLSSPIACDDVLFRLSIVWENSPAPCRGQVFINLVFQGSHDQNRKSQQQ